MGSGVVGASPGPSRTIEDFFGWPAAMSASSLQNNGQVVVDEERLAEMSRSLRSEARATENTRAARVSPSLSSGRFVSFLTEIRVVFNGKAPRLMGQRC